MRAILILFLFSIPAIAEARVYLEPAVGYEAGKSSETYPSTVAATAYDDKNGGGATYGAKLGYSHRFLFLGAEYEKGRGGSVDSTDISAFLGMRLFFGFRLWGSYIFNAQTENGKGKGYKVGLGSRFLYFFSLNSEYSVRNYDSYIGPALPATSSYSGSLKTFKVTISVPLRF